MRPPSRLVACLALLAGSLPSAAMAMERRSGDPETRFDLNIGFHLTNRTNQPATISIANQGKSTTVRAGDTWVVHPETFWVVNNSGSTAYYRIRIQSEGQTHADTVFQVNYDAGMGAFRSAKTNCRHSGARVGARVNLVVEEAYRGCAYRFTLT